MNDPWLTHDTAFEAGADPLASLDREWVVTNGTGAFAMGTLPAVNTRRYHGMLIASAMPPVGRVLALNQVLEQLVLRGPDASHRAVKTKTPAGAQQVLEFASCAFRDAGSDRDVYVPGGHQMLRRFRRGLSVVWNYAWGRVELERELHLHWQEQAATLRYRVRGLEGGGATLRLGPLLSLRGYHALLGSGAGGSFDAAVPRDAADTVTVTHDLPGSLIAPVVTLRVQGARFARSGDWWRNFHYAAETLRGQDDTEDNYLPGWFEIELASAREHEVTLTAALGRTSVAPRSAASDARAAHLAPIAQRLSGLAAAAPTDADPEGMARLLAIATDDFIARRTVKGEPLATIVAGYPWFTDWGRDTFIALPGLLLATGRHDEARAALLAFAGYIRGGLVPNVFDDYNAAAAHYNTVDASLWFVRTAMDYVRVTGDRESWRGWMAEACNSVIDGYIRGTSPPELPGDEPLIRMAGDGLITAGNQRTQLTWMDACRDGVAFTPRHGKAVEINALWYHALAGMAELLADTDKKTADHYGKLCSRIGRSFPKVFWNDGLGYLSDTVWTDAEGRDHADTSLRPNQVLAVSLPHSPLARKRQQQVIDAVRERLLTPFGLRTLPADDPRFHAHYRGSLRERDEAYHQGTIWPWLVGPYAEAVLRLGKFSDKARQEAGRTIRPLLEEMAGRGLGQLHEVYEAAEPHRPDGCVAQAWSVAEVVRVLTLVASPSS